MQKKMWYVYIVINKEMNRSFWIISKISSVMTAIGNLISNDMKIRPITLHALRGSLIWTYRKCPILFAHIFAKSIKLSQLNKNFFFNEMVDRIHVFRTPFWRVSFFEKKWHSIFLAHFTHKVSFLKTVGPKTCVPYPQLDTQYIVYDE